MRTLESAGVGDGDGLPKERCFCGRLSDVVGWLAKGSVSMSMRTLSKLVDVSEVEKVPSSRSTRWHPWWAAGRDSS